MIAGQEFHRGVAVPRGVRRALDAMRTSVGRELAPDGTRRHRRRFRPNACSGSSSPFRQDPARRASRHRVRDAPAANCCRARPASNDGCRAALRLSPLRPVFDRVSPPLWRNAVADAEAAGGVHGCARRDAFAVRIGAGSARGRLRADRGGGRKIETSRPTSPTSCAGPDPRRRLGRTGPGRRAII